MGVEINIHTVDLAQALLVKQTPRRYGPIVALLRNGYRHQAMIVAEGEDWRATHDALMPFFTAASVRRAYAALITDTADEAFATIARQALEDGAAVEGALLDIEASVRALVARVMGHVVFGRLLSVEEADALQALLDATTQPLRPGIGARVNLQIERAYRWAGRSGRQPIVIPSGQGRSARALLAWIGDRIEAAGGGGAPTPLLDALGERFAHLRGRRRLRAMTGECAMLFSAGVDTTSSALACALAELAAAPSALASATAEALGEGDVADARHGPTRQFPALNAVMQETLRRHTVVPTLLRETAASIGLPTEGGDGCPMHVPAGSTLRFLTLPGHMRGRIWGDARGFDPDRFRRSLTAEQRKNFSPFGLGPQSCMGRAMAEIESVLILRSFLRALEPVPAESRPAIRMVRNAMFTSRPVGLTIRVRPRKPELGLT